MTLTLGPGEWAVIFFSFILIVAYGWGYYRNKLRAAEVVRWLREGMGFWGEVRPGERLTGFVAGGRLVVPRARAPFRRLEATFVLEPRENPVFWLAHRLRGKRDLLVLHVDFRTAPRWEAIIMAGAAGDAPAVIQRLGRAFTLVPVHSGYQVYVRAEGAEPDVAALAEVLAVVEGGWSTLILERKKPHLTAHLDLRRALTIVPKEVWEQFRALAETSGGSGE